MLFGCFFHLIIHLRHLFCRLIPTGKSTVRRQAESACKFYVKRGATRRKRKRIEQANRRAQPHGRANADKLTKATERESRLCCCCCCSRRCLRCCCCCCCVGGGSGSESRLLVLNMRSFAPRSLSLLSHMPLLGATLNLTLNAVGGRAPAKDSERESGNCQDRAVKQFCFGCWRWRRPTSALASASASMRSINKWLSDAFSVLIRD